MRSTHVELREALDCCDSTLIMLSGRPNGCDSGINIIEKYLLFIDEQNRQSKINFYSINRHIFFDLMKQQALFRHMLQ